MLLEVVAHDLRLAHLVVDGRDLVDALLQKVRLRRRAREARRRAAVAVQVHHATEQHDVARARESRARAASICRVYVATPVP